MGADIPYADWIAVDWGTSRLRAWNMGADGKDKAYSSSDAGMGSLAVDEFEPALLALIDLWLAPGARTRIVACGMVGARQGWHEAPYAPVPGSPGTRAVPCAAQDARLDVFILPGLKQEKKADVMRGEETQIAGYLAGQPGFDGVICLPGTHTKWAHISAEEVVSFQTFMTGEMFDLTSSRSVLRHSMDTDWDEESFEQGLSQTLSRPASFAAELFSIRANQLLHADRPGANRARLSGLLIGLELTGAKPYWLGQNVAIIGDPALSRHYQTALRHQGVTAEIHDGDMMTLEGLKHAYRDIHHG